MLEIIAQVGIILLSVGAVYLLTLRKVVAGATVGLLSEPFWWYSAWPDQWGILLATILYSGVYIYALYKEYRNVNY